MKKFLVTIALSVVFTFGSFAAVPRGSSRVTTIGKKAKAQWNESLGRFKRCLKGQCTRKEALQAARDLGIAAVVTAATVYVLKTGFGLVPWSWWKPVISEDQMSKMSDSQLRDYYPVGTTFWLLESDFSLTNIYKAKIIAYTVEGNAKYSMDYPLVGHIEREIDVKELAEMQRAAGIEIARRKTEQKRLAKEKQVAKALQYERDLYGQKDINDYSRFGSTQLIHRVIQGDKFGVKALLDAGADPNIPEILSGIPSLGFAKSEEMKKLLRDYGAKTEEQLKQETVLVK